MRLKGLGKCRGRTALMVAAYHGHVGCVLLLAPTEAGKQDSEERCALALAVLSGNVACARLLLEREKNLRD